MDKELIAKLKENKAIRFIAIFLILWGLFKFIFLDLWCIGEIGFLTQLFGKWSCSTFWIWEVDLIFAIIGVTLFGIYYLVQVIKRNREIN